MFALRRLPVLCLCGLSALSGCDLPNDPENTLEQIRHSGLRVGVIQNPPWAAMTPSGARGVEPALLRELAAELGTSIEWIAGPEQELMQALEQRSLHVVIGGIADSNPWAKQLGVTKPFYRSRLLIAARADAPPLAKLDGSEIAAVSGSAAAGYLISKQARPLDPRQRTDWQYAAMPGWQTGPSGLLPTPHVLHEAKQIMLVPKGENDWLITLERFLNERRRQIPELLREYSDAYP